VHGNYLQVTPIPLYYTVGAGFGTGKIIVTMPQDDYFEPVICDTILVHVPNPHNVQVIRDWYSEFSNTVVPNGAGWSTFHIQNKGGAATTYNLSVACTGTLSNCILSRTSVSVAAFGDSTVRVNLTAGAEGTTGNVTVSAIAQGDTSHSSDGVTLTATAY